MSAGTVIDIFPLMEVRSLRYLPVFLDVSGRAVLVVGAGVVAARKIELLLRAGAAVTVVAPAATHEIADWAAGGRLRWLRRAFVPGDAAGQTLIYAATGAAATDRAVAEAAAAAGIPVNVVDRPELSRFVSPSIVERDPVTVAIATAGLAPALAGRVRAEIEAILPTRLGALARVMGRARAAVKTALPPAARR
ncbi:MAG: hypothetical protein FJX56_14060, partial [Alphaproteobacteria bacterium]|nr:hypothetical protein [Alphaproteobacteria bacterium]